MDTASPEFDAAPVGATWIRPRRGWVGIAWSELVEYRELLGFLVWRDIKVRYKQTVLGGTWAILQPLVSMIIFSLIFGKLAKIDSEGFPYAVFVYAGLLPWTFFSSTVSSAGTSLIDHQNLLTKVYCPRLFIPTACVGAGLVDFALSALVYVFLLAWFQVAPGPGLVLLPLLVLLTVTAALGFGLLLAALSVTYRDLRHAVPFAMQAMMFASPVVYPVALVPERFQPLLALNPMAGIIDGYRSAILGKPWNGTAVAVSAVVTVSIFVYGLYVFRKTERRFADIA